jgi:hypothetical protein
MPSSRSGWNDGRVSGGPVAGLLAREILRSVDNPSLQLTRLTIDLFHPVPMSPLQVTLETLRRGSRIHVVEAHLLADGNEVTRATGQFLRRTEPVEVPPLTMTPPPGPDTVARTLPPANPTREFYHYTVDRRRIPPVEVDGDQVVWARPTQPLIEDEAWSPETWAAAMCDALTGSGGIQRDAAYPAINSDITLYLHRPPAGEWLCMQVQRVLTRDGIGVTRAALFDGAGSFGAAAQAALRNEIPRR